MRKRGVWGAVTLAAAVLVPASPAANGSSITANPGAPGVYFTVTGKSTANRDYLAIEVTCDSGYGTRIFVTLQNGAGTSQTIYPPAGSCTAQLEAPQSINRFRVLDTITFSIT